MWSLFVDFTFHNMTKGSQLYEGNLWSTKEVKNCHVHSISENCGLECFPNNSFLTPDALPIIMKKYFADYFGFVIPDIVSQASHEACQQEGREWNKRQFHFRTHFEPEVRSPSEQEFCCKW